MISSTDPAQNPNPLKAGNFTTAKDSHFRLGEDERRRRAQGCCCSSRSITYREIIRRNGWIYAGKGVNPSHRRAQVSHVIKAVQFISLLSVVSFCWPPWYSYLFFFLNFRVYQLLGETGTYYGVRFGKNVPWVTEFPFEYIKDPQYTGSILSLLACSCWVPFQYVLLWILGYLFIIRVESFENPATRAKPLS